MILLDEKFNEILISGVANHDESIIALYVIPDLFKWLNLENIKIKIDIVFQQICAPYEKISETNVELYGGWINFPDKAKVAELKIYFQNQEEMNFFLLSCR